MYLEDCLHSIIASRVSGPVSKLCWCLPQSLVPHSDQSTTSIGEPFTATSKLSISGGTPVHMVAAKTVATMQNGLIQGATPMAKPMTYNEHQALCFNKAHFSRSDFSVERFVGLARRRATLDQLHNDLRAYLRILQNSMVELINDDYTEFVNLSSNLAALKESIDKISSDFGVSLHWNQLSYVNRFQHLWASFGGSTSDIQRTAEVINHKCDELSNNRKEQMLARNQISLLLSIERLSSSMQRRPAELSEKWYVSGDH